MKKVFWSYFKHYGRFLGKNLTNESARRWEKNSSYKTIKNIRLASTHAVSSTSSANGIETTWAEIGKMIVLVLNDLSYIKKFFSGYSCFFLFLKNNLKTHFFLILSGHEDLSLKESIELVYNWYQQVLFHDLLLAYTCNFVWGFRRASWSV